MSASAWLASCRALASPVSPVPCRAGSVPEGIAHAEEAVHIAEAVDHPHSLMHAYLGVGFSPSATRTSPGPSPCSNAALISAVFNFLLWFPDRLGPGLCVYLCRPCRRGPLPLLEGGGAEMPRMGTMGGHALRVGYVSEAYLLAGRMQEAVQLAGRALDLPPVPIRSGDTRRGPCGSSGDRRPSGPQKSSRARTSLPAGLALADEHAPTRGPLPPRSGRCMPGPASGSRPALSCPRPSRCIAPWT